MEVDGAPLPLVELAAAHPQPNQPETSAARAVCSGLTPIDHSPPAPPLPRPPQPSPPRRSRPRRGSARRRAAEALQAAAVAEAEAAGPDAALAAAVPDEEADWGGAEGGAAQRFLSTAVELEPEAGAGSARRSLQQQAPVAPYYGNWSNAQLIEAWLVGPCRGTRGTERGEGEARGLAGWAAACAHVSCAPHASHPPTPQLPPPSALTLPPAPLQDGSMSNMAGKDYRALRISSRYAPFGPSLDPRAAGFTAFK